MSRLTAATRHCVSDSEREALLVWLAVGARVCACARVCVGGLGVWEGGLRKAKFFRKSERGLHRKCAMNGKPVQWDVSGANGTYVCKRRSTKRSGHTHTCSRKKTATRPQPNCRRSETRSHL